jgi:hypothetical protein
MKNRLIFFTVYRYMCTGVHTLRTIVVLVQTRERQEVDLLPG